MKAKIMVRESIRKMKNVSAAGPLGLVSEIVESAEEAKINMIKDQMNQIIAVILAELEVNTIVNCYKRKRNTLEGRNSMTLK